MISSIGKDRICSIRQTIEKCDVEDVRTSLENITNYLVDKYDDDVGSGDFMRALDGLELLAEWSLPPF